MIFNQFLTVLSYEVTNFLKKNPDFFDGKEEERMNQLDHVRIPKHFKVYLSQGSEKHFMEDLHVMLRFTNGDTSVLTEKSELFKTMVEFFTGPFASKLDKLFGDYYILSDVKRQEVVEKLITSDSRVAEALRHMIHHYTYQQLAEGIHMLCEKVMGAPYIVVQTPRELDAESKKDMRKQLLEETPHSFSVFQINRKLIGGLRIFKNGEVIDHSWLSRVHRFLSLTSA